MISSPVMDGEYDRLVPDYTEHRKRQVPLAEAPDQPNLPSELLDDFGG